MTPAWLNEVRLDATLPRILFYKSEIRDVLEAIPQDDPEARDMAAPGLAARYPQIEALAILLRAPETLEDPSTLDELKDLLELARSPGIQPILKQYFPPEELTLRESSDSSRYRHQAVEPSEIRESAAIYDSMHPYSEEHSDREAALRLDIELRRGIGDLEAQARSMNKLARLKLEEGELEEAESWARSAIGLWRGQENLVGVLTNLTTVIDISTSLIQEKRQESLQEAVKNLEYVLDAFHGFVISMAEVDQEFQRLNSSMQTNIQNFFCSIEEIARILSELKVNLAD